MWNVICDNERYDIAINVSINRMKLSVKGLWQTGDGYLEDLEKACKGLKPGFDLVANLTAMKPAGAVGVVHEKAQKLLLSCGLLRTAEVQSDRAIVRITVDRYSDNSGMEKQVFTSSENAIAWLDEMEVSVEKR